LLPWPWGSSSSGSHGTSAAAFQNTTADTTIPRCESPFGKGQGDFSSGFLRRVADDGTGPFEIKPAHEEKCLHADADLPVTGPGPERGVVEDPDTVQFTVQVPAVRRRGSRQNPGHVTSRHVPGGWMLSSPAHHGLEVEDDRNGAIAALADVRRRPGFQIEHSRPFSLSLPTIPHRVLLGCASGPRDHRP